MSASRWIKRLTPVVALALMVGVVVLKERMQSAPPSDPPAPASGIEVTVEPNEAARTSEHFQIVDDALEGDSPVTQDLALSDAAGQLDGEVLGASSTVVAVKTNATVTHVADGDTFDVKLDSGEKGTVRMLGVDTPETVDPRKPVQCFGIEASNFSKGMLGSARVRLDPDPQADEHDQYGRLLRNVTLEDGTDYNAKLISNGYAYAYLSFPLDPARKKQLKDLETEAKKAGKGLWAPDACDT